MEIIRSQLRSFSLLFVIIFSTSACSGNPINNASINPPAILAEDDNFKNPLLTVENFQPADHIIAIRQTSGEAEFFNRLTEDPFIPRGVNYVFVPRNGITTNLLLKVGIYDPQRTRDDFSEIAASGFNTIRVFLDQCSSGEGCIGNHQGPGLNPEYLDNIADMLAAAKQNQVFILFTSNDLPDDGGYSEQANLQSGENFSGYRNSFYLTPGAVEATKQYWRDLISGLQFRQAPTEYVLGWQLLNEQWMFEEQPPLSLESGIVETTTGSYDMGDESQKNLMVSEGLVFYIAEVRREILRLDPSALITMGFFAPGAAPGWYVETASLLDKSDLDFFDFHAYSGWESLAELVDAFGMEGFQSKPILLGEFGAFRDVYPTIQTAARAVTQWQAQSCEFGFDGWLYWTYYPAGPRVSDRTWGLVDQDGFLLEMLSPLEHPDPCAIIEIPTENLAYLKPVRASASLGDQPPANALDEVSTSQWGAGNHAPQWIEVDLGEAYTIREIRLQVAQHPPGETIHRLLGRSSTGDFFELQIFEQSTAEGDWLVFTPETAIENVQFIRIETISSPSWVAWAEIEVFGEN